MFLLLYLSGTDAVLADGAKYDAGGDFIKQTINGCRLRLAQILRHIILVGLDPEGDSAYATTEHGKAENDTIAVKLDVLVRL